MSVDLVARFQVRDGEHGLAAGLLADYARTVRSDPGTVLFEPLTVRARPSSFLVLERYADEAAFERHLRAPENAAFNARLRPLLVGEVELEFLSMVT